MPLQNRVAPDGSIHATPHRGMFTGNRGIIHDPAAKRLLARRWTNKAWIICLVQFRGRRREVMGARSWTELFFLDEVTALAAGHRPCFECRRADANAFASAFPRSGNRQMRAGEIDSCLHDQRASSSRQSQPRIASSGLALLPDGAVLRSEGDFFALFHGRFLRWSFAGYDAVPPPSGEVRLVTPPATVEALKNGYRPAWHPSAQACTA
jgi:hypothetical protein